MRRVSILLSFLILFSAVMIGGCSKKEEATKAKPGMSGVAAQDQARIQAATQAQVQALSKAGPAVSADMAKVYALYDDFKTKFVRTRDFQPSIDTTADASYSCGRIAGEINDPEAKAFLAKFTDLLQQYRDEAKTFFSKDERLKEDYKRLVEIRNNNAGRLSKWELDKLQSSYDDQRAYVRQQADRVQDVRKQLLTLKS
jgi:hypothetical protein